MPHSKLKRGETNTDLQHITFYKAINNQIGLVSSKDLQALPETLMRSLLYVSPATSISENIHSFLAQSLILTNCHVINSFLARSPIGAIVVSLLFRTHLPSSNGNGYMPIVGHLPKNRRTACHIQN